MGLTTKQGGNLVFLKVKDGSILIKDDANEYKDVQGYLAEVRYRTDTFEGNDIETMNITLLSDDGTKYVFPTRVGSKMWATVAGGLVLCDTSKQVRINVGGEKFDKDGTSKIRSFAWVTQNGAIVKSKYSKDNAQAIGLPEWKKVVVGKKTIWDFEAWEQFIKADIKVMCDNLTTPTIQAQPVSAPKPIAVEEKFSTPADDSDLPF